MTRLCRWRENRPVDGWDVVALVPVHAWMSLLDVYGLLDLAVEPVFLTRQYLGVLQGDRVAGVVAVFPYGGGFIELAVFFEPLLEWWFCFADVRVCWVVVACDVIYGVALLLLWCLVLRVYDQ